MTCHTTAGSNVSATGKTAKAISAISAASAPRPSWNRKRSRWRAMYLPIEKAEIVLRVRMLLEGNSVSSRRQQLDGKPISKLALFRGLETSDPNSLLRDLRKRSMVLSFDRTTSCYQLRQVGCIVLTPEDIH